MKITKYEHACLDIELEGKRLIIDPGNFTTSLINFENICGVVVTHVHPDHFNIELLDSIQAANPEAPILTVSDVAGQLEDRKHEVVKVGTSELCGIFHVSFFGGEHAVIHESYPLAQNIGVLVNETLYYPGDSFVLPHVPIKVLAIPASAPWMRVGEAMDFVAAIKPETAFPTHNAILSEAGADIHNRMLEASAVKIGTKFVVIQPGESLSV